MMNTNEIVETLGILMLIDFDAAHAYEEALENTNDSSFVKDSAAHVQLTLFRKDHQSHVFTLSERILGMGGNPPPHSNDFRAYIHKDFISPLNVGSSREIFETLQRNEQMVSNMYARALEQDLPEDIKTLLKKHFNDEQKHLGYIESVLELSPIAR
jgi:rubrerythrin